MPKSRNVSKMWNVANSLKMCDNRGDAEALAVKCSIMSCSDLQPCP